MITNHAPITKYHLTCNSRGSVQFFVETSDGQCYLTRVVNSLSDLYYNFSLELISHCTSIDCRLDFLNSSTGPADRVRFKLLGSFDSLDEILQTCPELLL